MKFLVFTRPIDGIMDKLPRPEGFEAQSNGFASNSARKDLIVRITARTTR